MREGYLHDYLAASFIGIAIAGVVSQPAGNLVGNWGAYIGALLVAGLFGFIPGGFLAGYINLRFHRVGENLEMAGLSAGFFTAVVYTIITFFMNLVYVIIASVIAGTLLIGWIIGVLFAFIFFSLGGYISGYLERRPFAMPTIFNLSRISRAPPPPPGGVAQMCPTCGQPLTFVQQYNRWYCANCKKYQ
jgi:hypothetical protein